MTYYLHVHPSCERVIAKRIAGSRFLQGNVEKVAVPYPGMGYVKVTVSRALEDPERLRISGVYRVLEEVGVC